jgi:hypothetical protein
LTQGRLFGFAANRATVQEMEAVLQAASAELAAMAGKGTITSTRAAMLRADVERLLGELEKGIVGSVVASVNRVVSAMTRFQQEAALEVLRDTSILTPGREVAIRAGFAKVPQRALSALYGRRAIVGPLQTVVRRHLLDAQPAIDRVLAVGVTEGKPTSVVAKELATLMGGEESAALKGTKVGGLRSLMSDARMIARSEVANAMREATAQSLTQSGVVEAAEWQLSGNHPVEDECDELATTDIGYGPGFYPPAEWPEAPHPNCTCYAGRVKLLPVEQWGRRQPAAT